MLWVKLCLVYEANPKVSKVQSNCIARRGSSKALRSWPVLATESHSTAMSRGYSNRLALLDSEYRLQILQQLRNHWDQLKNRY